MGNSKKIILVANAAFTITNFRKELIEKFVDMNYQVIVACPSSCTLSGENDVSLGIGLLGATHFAIPLSRSGINPFSEIKLLLSLIGLFRKEQPDVVLNYTIKPTIYGSIAASVCRKTKIFSTITGLGYLFTSRSIKSKLLNLVVRIQYYIALRRNTLVFFQNSDDLRLFEEIGLLKGIATKIVNGSGVNLAEFQPSEHEKRNNSFIMIGRILKDKGVEEYIEAARILKMKYPDALFQLLGPMDNNPAAYNMQDVQSWQEEGIIEYIPPTSDVRPYLARTEVFVLPSYREGTPRSTLEAMAMGMPVVTTDAPGCKETVTDDVNGFQVSVRNHRELADAMEKFILNDSLLIGMGRESLKLARLKYDVNVVNESIVGEVVG